MFKGYKTLAFGVLTMLGGAVQASTGVLSPDQVAIAVSILGALTMILRLVTNTPPLSSTPKPPAA